VSRVADERGKTGASQGAGSKDRRLLLRIGAATAIGGLVLGRAVLDLADAGGARASVDPTCRGCTGCAAVCPEAAISVSPGGIEIAEERCVRCGYCVAVCPVEGVLVHREDGRA
jgi:ferredoxin